MPNHRFLHRALILCFALLACFPSGKARAAFSVITLAGQFNKDANLGYSLNIENNTEGDAPLTLSSLKVALGVGDGKQWTCLTASPAWATGHTYTVQATIGRTNSTLAVDGQVAANLPTHLVSAPQEFVANTAIDWANPTTPYWVVENSVALHYANAPKLNRHFTLAPSNRPALFFSARQPLQLSTVPFTEKYPVTVVVTFTLVARPAAPTAFAPLIDRYGQAAYGTWPGKILSDKQLIASAADEQKRLAAMPPPPESDVYGGLKHAGWNETPTGFYLVTRRRGYDWLITPTGLPCFYMGVCTAPLLSGNGTPISGRETLFGALPPKTPPYAPVYQTDMLGSHQGTQYAVFDTANMMTKYGKGWQGTASALTPKRLRAWGFAGFGKWSDPIAGLPYLVVLNRNDVPTLHGKPDVFDPVVRARFAQVLGWQIKPHQADPFLVGWSLGNEYDEIVEHTTISGILADTLATPAKKALLASALQSIYHGSFLQMAMAWKAAPSANSLDALGALPLVAPAADLETLRRFFADRYYQFLYNTVKSLDPHHLYMGFWIVPGWWENESDWTMIARHCDVVGFDYYSEQFADPLVQRLIRQTDKPVFCGEFGYPPTYKAARGFGLFRSGTQDDAASARHYAHWMQQASRNSHCIGGSWFEYRDEPVSGRGPGQGPDAVIGENYAFGLVDVADRPKWDLVTGMRAANSAAAPARLRATAAAR